MKRKAKKSSGAQAKCGDGWTTNDDINQDIVEGMAAGVARSNGVSVQEQLKQETLDVERLVAVERAASELVAWTTHGVPEQMTILGEVDYEEERSRRMQRLAQALHGGVKFLDVFGIDDAGVYHPPSRERYLQWEERHERTVGLLLRFAEVIEVLDPQMPPSSTVHWDMEPGTKRELADRILALPSGWRREVFALREEAGK